MRTRKKKQKSHNIQDKKQSISQPSILDEISMIEEFNRGILNNVKEIREEQNESELRIK